MADATVRRGLMGIVTLRWMVLRLRYYGWLLGGRAGMVPHVAKERVLKATARRFGLRVLVETGTYMGDMIAAVGGEFDRVYSVEVDEELHRYARERFRRQSYVTLLHGDSQNALPGILARESEPILFWLDAHYSGGVTGTGVLETPIVRELEVIARHSTQNHVILIDDARCFDGTRDYPEIGELRRTVATLFPGSSFVVQQDTIHLVCGNAARKDGQQLIGR